MTHCFNTTLAERYGIEEAIILEHLYFWIHKNECEGEHVIDGRVWCYSSAKGFEKYIPYMNAQKIRRTLRSLEEKGKILISNHNASAMNKTLWYAFTDEMMEEMERLGYEFSKMKNRIFKNEKSEDNIQEDNIEKNKKENPNNKLLGEKEKEKTPPVDTSDVKEQRYNAWMAEHYPRIQQMEQPLLYKQFCRLRDTYDETLLRDKMDALENKRTMKRDYVSAYLTLNNWCKMQGGRTL